MTWPTDTVTAVIPGAVSSTLEADVPVRYFGGGSLEPADSTPPVVTNIAPSLLTPLSPYAPVSFDLLADDVATLLIFVAGRPRTEVIYELALGLQPGYSLVRSAITGGYRYVIRSDDGWPAGTIVYVSVSDTAGNVTSVVS